MLHNARSAPRVLSRLYSSGRGLSRHAQVYTAFIPAMIPVFLLGSAVYFGLELTQLKLSHEKYMTESTKHIEGLEAEIAALQEKRAQQNKIANVTQSSSTSTTSPLRWWGK